MGMIVEIHEGEMKQDDQEEELHQLTIAATDDDAYDRLEHVLFDSVCEEDENQDLERTMLKADLHIVKNHPGWKKWVFGLDESDQYPLYGIIIGPDYETVKKQVQEALEKK